MYKHLPVQCIAFTRLGFRVISPNIHKKVSLGQALDTSQLRKRSRVQGLAQGALHPQQEDYSSRPEVRERPP